MHYYQDVSCKNSACSAAKTLAGHSHMNVYEAIGTSYMEVGMMWHGMALIHDAMADSRFYQNPLLKNEWARIQSF